MPVISPRRTSATTSGNLYIPPSTASTSGLSSSLGKSITSSSNSSGYSSTYRSSSLSKPASSSTYNSSLNYSTGSFLPRTPAYRTNSGTTSGASSYGGSSSLSGGSAYVPQYRQNSYLSSGNNDSISSRFGQRKQRQSKYENNKDDHDGIHTFPLSLPSSSSASSSLARLVATCGLDLYEKYSPAHYIPKCELSRSRSVSEATTSVSKKNAIYVTDNSNDSTSDNNSTSLLYNSGHYNRNNNFTNNNTTTTTYNKSDNLSDNNNNNISNRNGLKPLRINNHSHLRVIINSDDNDDDDDDDNDKVGNNCKNVNGSVGGRNDMVPRNYLRDLKISSHPTDDEQDESSASFATVKLDIKQKRNKVVVVGQIKSSLSTNSNQTATTKATTATTATTTTNTENTKIKKSPAQIGNQPFFLISEFKDQNFLKNECELARAEVIRRTRSRSLSRKKSEKPIKDNENETRRILIENADFCDIPNVVDDDKLNYVVDDKNDEDDQNNNNHSNNKSKIINKLNGNNSSMQQTSTATTSTSTTLGNRRSSGLKEDINNKIVNVDDNVISKVTKLTHKLTSSAVAAAAASGGGGAAAPVSGGINCFNKTGTNLISSSTTTTSKFIPIKPLVHRSTISSNNKYLTKFLSHTTTKTTTATTSNNNMNCLENNSELLDDIKYIDSDETTTATNADPNLVTTMATKTKTQTIYHHYYHNHNNQQHHQHHHHHHHHHENRQQQQQNHQQKEDNKTSSQVTAVATAATHKVKLRPKSSIISSSNQNIFEKINSYKFVNGSILPTPPPAVGATINSNSVNKNNLSSATTTTTTTKRRELISNIDSNDIRASIERFNTLNELKRLSNASTNLNSKVNSGSASNLQHYQKQQNKSNNSTFDNDNNINYNRFAGGGGGGSGGSTLTRTSNRNSVAGSIVASKVIANLYSSPSPSTTASNSSIGGSTGSICSGTSSNNYGLAKTNGIKSTEASPSNSPQHLRKPPKGLIDINTIVIAPTSTTTTSTTNKTSKSSKAPSSSSSPIVASKTVMSSAATAAPITATTITTSSSPSNSSSDKKTNKLCDINESIRNASIRSALPPPSPTPTRYWDRDSNRSALLSTSRDDYGKTSASVSSSSALNNSSADEKSQSEGLCGLRNIGNTCFMNSVIQCLSHTTELTRFLKTQNSIRSTSSKDQQILYEYAKLIREMWTPNVHSVTPMELKRAFSLKHRMYSDYNQQDAQEFLRFFLDSLHCALNSGTKGEQLKIDDSMSDNRKADITWEWYSKQENSLIRDLFVGQLKSTLKCTTCGNASVTFDPFWDLSVSLPSSSRCKLDACLDLFIREEVLDGDEMPTCSKCKARRKCTKSFRIQRFPRYLVIHLKRFSETRWSKMSNIVEFPTGERELNMGPYGPNSSTNVYYSLYAISNHMGSTAGGHYVALCKHPITKKWHEFNDNIVSDDLSESHLVSSSAYILFYERAQRKPLSQMQLHDSGNNNVLRRRKPVTGRKKKKQKNKKKKKSIFQQQQQQQQQRWKHNQKINENSTSSDASASSLTTLPTRTTHQQLRKLILNAFIGVLFYAIICALCYYIFL